MSGSPGVEGVIRKAGLVEILGKRRDICVLDEVRVR